MNDFTQLIDSATKLSNAAQNVIDTRQDPDLARRLIVLAADVRNFAFRLDSAPSWAREMAEHTPEPKHVWSHGGATFFDLPASEEHDYRISVIAADHIIVKTERKGAVDVFFERGHGPECPSCEGEWDSDLLTISIPGLLYTVAVHWCACGCIFTSPDNKAIYDMVGVKEVRHAQDALEETEG